MILALKNTGITKNSRISKEGVFHQSFCHFHFGACRFFDVLQGDSHKKRLNLNGDSFDLPTTSLYTLANLYLPEADWSFRSGM